MFFEGDAHSYCTVPMPCYCSCSVAKFCLTLLTSWTAARQTSLSFTVSQTLLRLMFIESVMPYNHLILFCPLLLLPSIFPRISVFPSESPLRIRWPKYWSFSISPSNEYSGLSSFRIDWFDRLAVQGTLKSLHHYSLKASILRCSAFFMVQLARLYLTPGKPITLMTRTFHQSDVYANTGC